MAFLKVRGLGAGRRCRTGLGENGELLSDGFMQFGTLRATYSTRLGYLLGVAHVHGHIVIGDTKADVVPAPLVVKE